ncbi:hypothetical protein Tco_0770613 [Tanacetum coccineum]|uniref:Uncharacterized protein n=1 Tax=Tanacetum coccineum TaxID=301880 RepID=A0ABQ4ZDS6_9ASTR
MSKEVGTPRYLSLVVPQKKVGDEAIHKKLGDIMERDATTASSLEAEQDSGSGPRCQDTILGDVDAQTRFETTSKQSNDPLLSRGYTLESRKDGLKLLELIELFNAARPHLICYALTVNPIIYTSCIQQFWATEKANTVNGERQLQALIDKKKVIITESSVRSDLHLEDAGVTQEETQQDDNVSTPSNDPPLSEKAKDAQAKEIADLKKRVQVLERQKKSRTTGLKRLRKVGMSRRVESYEDKDSLVNDTQGRSDRMFDTNDLHSDEVNVDIPVGEKQEQSAKEREDNTQAMMEADFELAQRLQTEEQGEITIEERSRLFVELMNKRKKYFAMLRAEEKRRKPPTKAQKRNQISTYLKNMVKSKKETEESFKGTEDELKSDKSKKAERRCLIGKEHGKSNNKNLQRNKEWRMTKRQMKLKKLKKLMKLIRADGSSKRYSSMIRMLQGIDRKDLQTLWKLVKSKHGDTRPEDEHERVLWGDLKVMFEPNIKSDVWRNLQGYKVTIWKLFDSCGVHFVRFKNVHIFMLVEKRYPLTPITITNMLNKKLQTGY